MKANLCLFLFFFLLCTGCGKDEPEIEPGPDGPDTPVENTSTYVPIDWDKADISKMDLTTGNVTLTFSGEVPSFNNGNSLIVLETDTSAYIRRVIDSNINGKTANLQTIEADMTELFANTEFTLSLDPSAERTPTKAGMASISADGTLHPVRIVELEENKSYRTLYDIRKKTAQTKAEGETELIIKFPEVDKSGKVIAASEDGNLSLYWDTYKQNFSMNATAHFKFGEATKEKEITENLKINVSELEEFSFTIGAKAQWDMILGASAKGKFEYEENNVIIAEEMFKPRVFTFFTPTGIPVIITLGSDLLGDFSADGDAQVNIRGGVFFKGNLTIGIEYKEKKWQPIGKPEFEYQIHPLEIEAFANLNMKVSAYPKIKIKLYNFLGPAFSPKPFLKDSVQMGMFNEFGTVSKDYYGWTEKTYAGVDLQTSIMLDFIGTNKELPFSPITIEGRFYNAPDEIKLKSPANGTEIQLGTPTEVTFNVTRKLLGSDLPIHGVAVKFESQNGKVSQDFTLTDLQGNVKVQWTPTTTNDSLTAKIFDANGDVISQATFKQKEEEFTIVGKWWWKGGYMAPEPYPQKMVDGENYVEFFSDGTFKEVNNPLKNLYGSTWNKDEQVIGYGIGVFYTVSRGTYTYSNLELKTNTTYFYHTDNLDLYDLSGNFIRNDNLVFTDIPKEDRFGGKIEVFDHNNIWIHYNGNAIHNCERIKEIPDSKTKSILPSYKKAPNYIKNPNTEIVTRYDLQP
ncbi:hypothetical protein [uncultured Parabacteroides sp.]|jgi:hypothetical protein|uniref:hypothetical protein n=1 Tax=uncultured Parabacteroides sp. TaxID=512312 RepID=UPI0025E2DFDD|nr:hypothetical protein [uncultured Parabacteroides sp.]